MTLKQHMLLKKLPENNYNISKTAKEVGYSEQYSTGGSLYQTLRNSTKVKEYFNEQTVKRDIKKVKKLVLKKEDYTNFIRATELESKILGLQIDKSESKTELVIKPDEKNELQALRHSLLTPTEN